VTFLTPEEMAPGYWLQKHRGDYADVSWQEQRRCRHLDRGPGLFILVNGQKSVVEHCLACGHSFGFRKKQGVDIASLPLVRDNTRNEGSCPHVNVEGCVRIATNGAHTNVRACQTCGHLLAGTPTDNEMAQRLYARVIDLRVDDNGFTIAPPCERCGSQDGSEYHHWAPRAIFGEQEAGLWPGAYLCRRCHMAWHELVTPQLRRKTA
jgi:hypothetical protein